MDKWLTLGPLLAILAWIVNSSPVAHLPGNPDGNSIPVADALTGGKDQLCLTKGCIKAAHRIMQNMDDTVKPCDDFYKFACGNYVKNTFIPDDKTTMSQFSIIDDELKIKLRRVIEEEAKPGEIAPITMSKDIYKSCMNKDKIETYGLDILKNILAQVGGWPVVEGNNWDPAGFNWKHTVYKYRTLGYSVDYFIDFSVTIDSKNSKTRILDLDQPNLGMSRKYLVKGFNDSDVQSYFTYMVDLAVLMGADRTKAETELKESLLFEIQLAEFSLPKEERRNASALYNKMTVGDLQRRWADIPWLEYINNLLKPLHVVTEDEPVIVDVPSYLDQFQEFIKKTEKRVQANYVVWRAVSASISYLTEEVRDIQLDFAKKITGQEARKPRWKECMGVVLGSLSNAVGSMYVRRYFDENAKAAADEMVSDIRKSFDDILTKIDWMDEITRARALNKSKAITPHIAYPPELLENQKLEELYDGIVVSPDEYLKNMINLTLFGTNYAFKKLREPVDKNDWVTHGRAAVVNAYYSPLENSIQFPAGILQGVFFSNDRPRYMNYGGIGFVIGHEITHGFDDQGRQFNMDGDLVNWWEKETLDKFEKKANCIIDQYAGYTAKEVNMSLNGINTQGENIADNGGIKEAYEGYKLWVKRNGEEKLLPGLDYNAKQLLWLSGANIWCSKYRPESLKLRILTGYHSPAEFRVNGPYRNNPDFSKDWSCAAGSSMNPSDKCSVW